jgi:hypothetical protein
MKKNKKSVKSAKITIYLSDVLEAYCRWIFETGEDDSEIQLSRRHNIGRHIFSHVLRSTIPVNKSPVKGNAVTFILPTTNTSCIQLDTSYFYIDGLSAMQIRDYIQSDFNHWCMARFETGYLLGWTSQQIINAILRGLNARKNAVNIDAIKKNDYRNRRKKDIKRFELLLKTDF